MTMWVNVFLPPFPSSANINKIVGVVREWLVIESRCPSGDIIRTR